IDSRAPTAFRHPPRPRRTARCRRRSPRRQCGHSRARTRHSIEEDQWRSPCWRGRFGPHRTRRGANACVPGTAAQRTDTRLGHDSIERKLLRVEAQFTYAKRMEKVTALLPKTFELLVTSKAAIVRAFIEACPPPTINRLENARQFHGFLPSCWVREAPDPPYM